MLDQLESRIIKGAFVGGGTGSILFICYGEVAPNWLLIATAIFSLILGVAIAVFNPTIKEN